MSHLKSCHCCGLIQRTSGLPGTVCARCETALESWRGRWTGNQLSAALSLAALVLYLPAVTLPFLRIEQLGHAHKSSLLVGMQTLFAEGHVFVGVVVLIFSIVLPLLKLSALLFLSQRRWQLAHRHRALTYRIVEHLGRWGMLDVLLVAVLVAFIKLGGLVEFGAGPGLATFALFVILSLLASATFDPYCLWDDGVTFAAGEGSRTAPESRGEPTASGSANPQAETDAIPAARVPDLQKGSASRWVWAIPAVTLAIVVWLAWATFAARGRLITISFADGHGIEARDELRYHGIVAGEVESVALADDLMRVQVEVRLTPESDALAGEGARFWIVRPQADLTGIAGLETVVGSKYMTVIPGPANASRAEVFVGLEEPPLPDLEFPGGIEVILQSGQGSGLRGGLGVFYRDIRIGGVIETGLAGDGSAVETRVYVRPHYRHLIREKTEFWNAGGVHVVGGLTELSVHIGTLESLIRGGIGVSVPPSPGDEASSGHRYALHDRPEKEWLQWQPSIAVGDAGRLKSVPKTVPATLIWRHDGVVRNKTKTRTGSLLPIDGGLLGPRDLLTVPDRSISGTASLDVDGRTIALPADVQPRGKYLAVLGDAPGITAADVVKTRGISAPEDGFLVSGGGKEAVLIAAARFGSMQDGVWRLDTSLAIDQSHHGGALIATADGAAIGVVLIDDESAYACPLHGME